MGSNRLWSTLQCIVFAHIYYRRGAVRERRHTTRRRRLNKPFSIDFARASDFFGTIYLLNISCRCIKYFKYQLDIGVDQNFGREKFVCIFFSNLSVVECRGSERQRDPQNLRSS